MVDIIKKKYLINESENKEIVNEKVKIDLSLNTDKDRTGQVKGTVKDINGIILKGVNARIISKDGDFSLVSISDEKGEFYFNNIPENKLYKILLTMQGKDTYESNWFKAVEFFEYKELNFVLLDKETYSIILGTLNTKINTAINNVEIMAFNEDSNKNLSLISVVRSNSVGEFMFSNLKQGTYVIKIKNEELGNISKRVIINGNSQIIQLQMEI